MLHTHQDLVSIITPSYNSEKFISETINSIINQTYTNWELLITDDFSSDNTIKTIESFNKNDDRIKLFRLNENQGAGFARNNSIKESKGKFIAFCDSDDQWKPNKLEKQIHFIKQNNLVFTYSSYDVIDESGNFIKSINSPITLSLKNILSNNYVGCLTAIYDSEAIGKQYMPIIRKRQDWVLWINILKIIGKTEGLQDSLALYRLRKNSISSNKVKMLKYNWSVYYNVLGFNIIKTILLMINFTIHYAIKKIK